MSLRLGVIARAEDRGLGIQTWEVCRHLQPAKVLLVEPKVPRWPIHRERYADFATTPVAWSGDTEGLDKDTVKRWLADLDVVYTAETLYDWRLPLWGDAAVVCHLNPEMLRPDRFQTPGVTWWAATPWMLERYPGARVVPMPCPTDRFETQAKVGDVVRFLHVAGHVAMADRNGSQVVARAVSHIGAPCSVDIVGQDGRLQPCRPSKQVTVRRRPLGVANYWELYGDADVLVMPRRFGGLCLPVIEALGAGMAVLMTDVPPNDVWPGPRMPVTTATATRAVGGPMPIADVPVVAVSRAMTELALDVAGVADYQAEARAWSTANSWEAMAPRWWSELDAATK